MRVLVVEDSTSLQRVLTTALRRSGYVVDVAGDGEEGLWLAESNPYDVIVLDLMLPKRDGMSVLAAIRQRGKQSHVLVLTARDAIEDRVKGLRGGADDYLVKPFDLEELLARVHSLCRRAYDSKATTITVGELSIDTLSRAVRVGQQPRDLTAREYALLEYLARRRGAIVSRSEIEEHIYDGSGDRMSNVVDSAICALRKKLGSRGPLIHTRRRMGYVLDEVAPAAAES